MSAVHDLNIQIAAARTLAATLLPILENDDDLRRDMVEGETSLHDAIRQALARIVEIRALIEGIQATVNVLAGRAERLGGQERNIRDAIFAAMDVGGLRSLETPLGTVSRRAVAPSLVVTNEADIPAQFWTSQAPKLDRRGVLAALKEGATIPGAELSNGGLTLAIRFG